jgi:autotransporter-associated beta strand protein
MKTHRFRSTRRLAGGLAASFAGLALLTSQSAQAATENWTGLTDGTWGTAGNWSGSAIPDSTYDLTIAGPGDVAGTALNINVAAAAAANSINFTNTAATTLTNTTSGSNQTLTLSSSGTAITTGTGAVTIGSSTANQNVNVALGASQTWNVGSGGLTATNVISGSGFGITKSGTGTLTLSGANTYSGGTTLNAGTIQFSSNTAFGTGAITVNGGTIKNTAGVTTANNVVVSSGTTTLDVTGGNWQIDGNISGSGNITRGTGATLTLYLNGDNSGYTGTFTSVNNGNSVVRFKNVTAGSANGKWVFNNATVNRTTMSFGTGTISFGSMTGAGNVNGDVGGTKTISVGALGLDDTFSGVINNGVGGSVIALTKVGSGTMTLSGANAYTSTTTISAGKLNVTGSISGTGAVAVSGGTSTTLGGSGSLAGAVTVTNGSRLAPGVVTSSSNFGSAGTLTLSNTSGLTLTNANLDFDLSTTFNGSNDKITLSGLNAPLSFSTLNFSFGGTTLDTSTAYTLIATNGTGALTGDTSTITTDFSGITGGSYTATYSFTTGTGLQVTFTAVPEPHEFALAIVALLGVMVFIRRRNQQA